MSIWGPPKKIGIPSICKNRRRFEISEMCTFACSKEPDMAAAYQPSNDVTGCLRCSTSLANIIGCPRRFTFNFFEGAAARPNRYLLTS